MSRDRHAQSSLSLRGAKATKQSRVNRVSSLKRRRIFFEFGRSPQQHSGIATSYCGRTRNDTLYSLSLRTRTAAIPFPFCHCERSEAISGEARNNATGSPPLTFVKVRGRDDKYSYYFLDHIERLPL